MHAILPLTRTPRSITGTTGKNTSATTGEHWLQKDSAEEWAAKLAASVCRISVNMRGICVFAAAHRDSVLSLPFLAAAINTHPILARLVPIGRSLLGKMIIPYLGPTRQTKHPGVLAEATDANEDGHLAAVSVPVPELGSTVAMATPDSERWWPLDR